MRLLLPQITLNWSNYSGSFDCQNLKIRITNHILSICRVIFTGTVVVIPDIMALASPGERSECRRDASQRRGSTAGNEGVSGLKALGVRDLNYRLAFIANSVQVGYLCLINGMFM